MDKNDALPRFCWTVLYPNQEGKSFDFDLYSNVLIPEYVAILGDNCLQYEVHKGLAAPGAPNAHFVCITNIWVKSREEFRAAMSDPRMVEVLKQMATVSEIVPLRQLNAVMG